MKVMENKYPNLIKALSELELDEVPEDIRQRVRDLIEMKMNRKTANEN